MKLIIGLGNPGRGYAKNRHNAGFMCVNHIARAYNIILDRKQSKARVGTGKIAGEEVILAKPGTFMNLSGESVALLIKRYGISPDDLIVIHDDLDLPLGKIRIRKGSTSGGHKGVNSIITSLGTRDFVRIRIGIGRPLEDKIPVSEERKIRDYVLTDFTPEEKKIMTEVIARASEAVLCLISEGLTTAMNKFN